MNSKSALFLFALVLSLALTAAAVTGSGIRSVPYERMADGEPAVSHVTLNPAAGWTNSMVFVSAGDLVNVTAGGLVDPGVRLSRGPDGAGQDPLKEMTHQCPYMSLLGRLGDGMVFCVGANATFEVVEGGQLSFHVNELDALRFDDLGRFDIQVRVLKPDAKTPARPVVAVLPLVPVNLSVLETQGLNLALRARLGRGSRYVVMDQSQTDRALRIYQLNQLASPAVAQSVGRALSADQVIFGQVGQLSINQYTVTLQRLSTGTGKVENTVVETIECEPSQLPDRVAVLAERI